MATIMRKMNVISRCEGIYRTQQSKDNLPGIYHSYVFAITGNPGLSQDKLAKHMCINKSSVTRHLACLEKEGYEADDILGTLSRMCVEKGKKCTIITGDRDSFQLINDFVTVKLPSTKKGHTETIIYDIEKIKECYNLAPIEMIQVKALMGDGSDNIPGVAGVGEKTALKLISDYKTLEGIYENIDNIKVTFKDGRVINENEWIDDFMFINDTIHSEVTGYFVLYQAFDKDGNLIGEITY